LSVGSAFALARVGLDGHLRSREGNAAMQKLSAGYRAASLVAIALLAACSSEPENLTADGPADPDAANVAAAPPAPLPPALSASRTYRCKDNSLFYVDFFADNLSADLRTDKTGPATKLTAPEAGKAFEGSGYTLTGSGSEVTLAAPGKGSQSCKA
jgi:hypothetical protein